MNIISISGDDAVAKVYIASMSGGRMVEFAESVQPGTPRDQKWVTLISTMFGCPVGCIFCDAGGHFEGKLTTAEILEQIDYLVGMRYPSGAIPCRQFKIQFARMGEPSLNPAVADVLEALPDRYNAPGLIPSISTIAPNGAESFFERLIGIKNEKYDGGRFQLQFSIHSTDPVERDRIIPAKKWSLQQIAGYGEQFFDAGDRKITLNFALIQEAKIDTAILRSIFDPAMFLIKMTPVNPTYRARECAISSHIDPERQDHDYEIVQQLRRAGFEVIVSIGDISENQIGSNCGQYIQRHLRAEIPIGEGYRLA